MKNTYFLYSLLMLCLSLPMVQAQDKPSQGLVLAFDSLKVQIKEAEGLIADYGDEIDIQSLHLKVSDEYPNALNKVRQAQWKDANERFFAESVLLPAFSGRKDLLNAMNKAAKNRQVNTLVVRNKLTYDILKYDIVLLVGELAPKYATKLEKSKAATEGAVASTKNEPGKVALTAQTAPKQTEAEAKDAKDAAINLVSSHLEAFMIKHNEGNPKLSVDQWKMLWNQLKAGRNSKDIVVKGQRALKDYPKILETEKFGSNMRNALEALANLDK